MADQFTLDDQPDVIELRHHWDLVILELEATLPNTVLDRFLRPLEPVGMEGDRAVVHSPSAFVSEWVKDKYLDSLTDRLSALMGRRLRLDLKVIARERAEVEAPTVAVTTTPATPIVTKGLPYFRPNPRQRFDSFVVGSSSRMAYAGCSAVADSPGTKYNPLFIYGPSGLGKTHLLNSIANRILAKDPHYPVVYMTAQKFAEDFVHALQNNRIDQFRRMQRGVSVWLLDDVQFIAGKDRTQEELFHTFNYLHGLNKQIVLCSDRPPRDLLLMEERLRSRFESGLVTDIQMPDTETRCAIVQKKAEQEGIALDHEVAFVLAEGITSNVRLLEGALNRLAAQASIDGAPISKAMALEMIDSYYRHAGAPKPSFDQILSSVCRQFKVDKEEVKGTSRKAPIAHARHVAVYLTREITKDSWMHIGKLFGDRDHTSMMHGYKKIRELLNHDRELSASVRSLMQDLYPEP